MALALVSLVTGAAPNRSVAVYGECMAGGAMQGFGFISAACLHVIHQWHGVTTVLMSPRDADALLETSPEIFQPTYGGPKVCGESMHVHFNVHMRCD